MEMNMIRTEVLDNKEVLASLKLTREYLYRKYLEALKNEDGPEEIWNKVAYLDKEIVRLEVEDGKKPCLYVDIDTEELALAELKLLGISDGNNTVKAVWTGDLDTYFELNACWFDEVLVEEDYVGVVKGMFAADDITEEFVAADDISKKMETVLSVMVNVDVSDISKEELAKLDLSKEDTFLIAEWVDSRDSFYELEEGDIVFINQKYTAEVTGFCLCTSDGTHHKAEML